MAPPPSLRRRAALVAAALLAAWAPPGPAGASDGLEAARQRRDEVRQERAALAAELDVLGADKAAIEAVLDTLQANAAAEQARLGEATRAAEDARAEAARAFAEEARIEADLAELQGHVQELAVDAFIGEGGQLEDLALLLRSSDAREAAKVSYLAGIELERQDELAAALAVLADELEAAREAAEAARARTTRDEALVAARLADVEAARDLQAGFVAEVEAELERRLAEAAALAHLDQELAARIHAEETAIAARLAAEADAEARARLARAEARDLGSVLRPVGSLVSVRGIVVDASIAANLEAMLAAAAAEGITLAGGGFRDAAGQIATRRANCGSTDYDVYEKPASHCDPPTARPGHSMHELGLAVDLTSAGRLITSRSDPAFVWLDANAARFGFKNLPSEPWHWSTNGH